MGEEDGPWGRFYENGQLVQDEFYEMGLLRKVGSYHTIRGDTLSPGTLENGYGQRLTYFPTGELESSVEYQNGLSNGPGIYYFRDGKKSAEGNLENGQPTGTWVYYFDNGRVESMGNFVAGEKTGKWKYYSRSGRLLDEVDHSETAATANEATVE